MTLGRLFATMLLSCLNIGSLQQCALADGIFHDHCRQSECVREWVEKIVSTGDNIYSVLVTFADYDAGDDPVVYSKVSKESDTVSCRKDDPWVSMKVYANLGEPKTVPEQSEELIYDGDDRTHLWRAVCLGKYVGD